MKNTLSIRFRRLRTLPILAAVAFSAAPVSAAEDTPSKGSMPMHGQGSMPGMQHSMPDPSPSSTAAPDSESTPSTAAYQAVMMKMHEGQQVGFTGDPDQDFSRHMIAHHQSAIDMARVELQYGRNPEIRKLAEKMIADQQKEITVMQKWLDMHATGAR